MTEGVIDYGLVPSSQDSGPSPFIRLIHPQTHVLGFLNEVSMNDENKIKFNLD